MQMVKNYMKYQRLFFLEETRKNAINLLSAEFAESDTVKFKRFLHDVT